MKIIAKKNENTLTSILSLLNVEYTREYTNKYFNEHPYKYSLFGLSKMLTNYGVYNKGIKIASKEDIHFLEPPFIAHIGNDFVTVDNISEENISYYWYKRQLTIPINIFLEMWSGTVLLAESNDDSIEPDYKQHKRKEQLASLQIKLLQLAGIVLGGIGIYQNAIFSSGGLTLLFVLNLVGIYIGYLLIQKQINIHSNVANKICSLFAHSDCNDVLKSPASKFLGVIGWSELGFSYFLSNAFLILFIPKLLPFLVFFNILSLPYSFWSIWYQKFRAKTWCPLCLIVQLLFWLLFISSSIFGFIQIPHFTIMNCLSIALIYGIPFLTINIILPHQITEKKLAEITQQFNSLQVNDKIFLGLLRDQPFYEVDKNVPTIMFGNPNAKNIITVFSNPHCEPCANMHKKLEQLLKDTKNQYCIQYILSSFNESVNSSCEFLIYVNNVFPEIERNRVYNEWFDKGKYDRENFFKKYSFIENKNISEEFQKHLEWKNKTKLNATPTVLFNGYELPEMFFQQVDKLVFFTDLEIDPK